MCTLKQRTSSNLVYLFHLEADFDPIRKNKSPEQVEEVQLWSFLQVEIYSPPQKKTNTGSHSLSCESTWQLSLSLSESERPLNHCSTEIIKSWAAYCVSSQDAIQATEKNILLTINYTRCFMRDPYNGLW